MHLFRFVMYNAVYIGITSQCFGKVWCLHLLGYATTNSEDSHQAPATSVTKYRSIRRHNPKTEIFERSTPLLGYGALSAQPGALGFRSPASSFLYTNFWSLYAQCMSASA
jgi:hypothetical protein